MQKPSLSPLTLIRVAIAVFNAPGTSIYPQSSRPLLHIRAAYLSITWAVIRILYTLSEFFIYIAFLFFQHVLNYIVLNNKRELYTASAHTHDCFIPTMRIFFIHNKPQTSPQNLARRRRRRLLHVAVTTHFKTKQQQSCDCVFRRVFQRTTMDSDILSLDIWHNGLHWFDCINQSLKYRRNFGFVHCRSHTVCGSDNTNVFTMSLMALVLDCNA